VVPDAPLWLALLLASPTALAQPGIDYVAETHGDANTAASRASFNKRVAAMGADRYLVVALALPTTAASVASVSYAGAPLMRLGTETAGTSCRIELYGLADPATGVDREVVVTLAGTAGRVAWATFDFTGVDQVRPTGSYASRAGAAGPASITIDHPEAAWLVVQACRVDGSGVIQSDYAVTRMAGWTFNMAAGPWAVGGVALLPASGGAADGGRPDGAAADAGSPDLARDGQGPGQDTRIAPASPDAVPASVGLRQADLQVGCACRAGGGGTGPWLPLGVAWLVARHRKRSYPRNPAGIRS
jgi:MYXO-CTERM domain-containing protein